MARMNSFIILLLTFNIQAGGDMRVDQIYKVLTLDQYTVLKESGDFTGAPVDIADGYIHMSTNDQYKGVIERYFAGVRPIYIVAFEYVDYEKNVKWEVASNGEEFPHIYNVSLKAHNIASVEEIE